MIVFGDLVLQLGDGLLVARGELGLAQDDQGAGGVVRGLERRGQVHRVHAGRAGRQEGAVVGVDRAAQRGEQRDAQGACDHPEGDDRVPEPDGEPCQPSHEVPHRCPPGQHRIRASPGTVPRHAITQCNHQVTRARRPSPAGPGPISQACRRTAPGPASHTGPSRPLFPRTVRLNRANPPPRRTSCGKGQLARPRLAARPRFPRTVRLTGQIVGCTGAAPQRESRGGPSAEGGPAGRVRGGGCAAEVAGRCRGRAGRVSWRGVPGSGRPS